MRRKHMILGIIPLVSLMLASCGEDRWPAYHDQTYRSLWVDSVMRQRYLWAEELPSSGSLTSSYFLEPDEFLSKILNKKDTYSSIDSVKNLSKASQGISYEMYQSTDTISGEVRYIAQISLVEPGSPAQKAGLERGDWILEAGGAPLDSKAAILEEGSRTDLLVATLNQDGSMGSKGLVSIPEAMDFPRVQILAMGTGLGKQEDIAYICPRSLSEEAISELQEKDAGDLGKAGKLVLDLRYCQDGSVDGLQKMASIILSASHGGEVLSLVERHGPSGQIQEEVPILSPELQTSFPVLHINRLVVVTSSKTRGEAEMLINCLGPYIDLIHIGEITQGVAYSREKHLSPDGVYLLRPVTEHVLNKFQEATYQGTGITPDMEIHESDYPQMVQPLGSTNEILLRAAIAILDE